MNDDEKLLIELATPVDVDGACRLLRHPLVQALEFADSRAARGDEFYRRLAGSLRKAYQVEIDAGRA